MPNDRTSEVRVFSTTNWTLKDLAEDIGFVVGGRGPLSGRGDTQTLFEQLASAYKADPGRVAGLLAEAVRDAPRPTITEGNGRSQPMTFRQTRKALERARKEIARSAGHRQLLDEAGGLLKEMTGRALARHREQAVDLIARIDAELVSFEEEDGHGATGQE